jgi:hypothetical protein
VTKKSNQNGKFRLVVAIDETSTYRQLTRALISDVNYFGTQIENRILDLTVPPEKKVEFEFMFSVAGTRACMQYIGSQPSQFAFIDPTATEGLTWKSTFREAKIIRYLTGKNEEEFLDLDVLEQKFQTIGCLMENGRMSSIALDVL